MIFMEEQLNFKVRTTEGKEFLCSEGDAILDSALLSGIVLEHSCKTGKCGACEVSLLQGEVVEIRKKKVCSEGKNNRFLTCRYTPRTDILIDAIDLSVLHNIKTKVSPARIHRLEKLSGNMIEVELRLPPALDFIFAEGQFVDIIGPEAVKRSYSIMSTSLDKTITLLIQKVQAGVLSNYWFNLASEEDLLRIEGPKGTFFLRDASAPLVFLATGSGIAPVISMLSRLDRESDFCQSEKIKLFWGNRLKTDFVWQPDFQNIDVDFYPVLSKEDDEWDGMTGYVQSAALLQIDDIERFSVYACGSDKMITSARDALSSAGVNLNRFYSDVFLEGHKEGENL